MWRAIQPIVELLGAEFHGRPSLRQVYAPIASDKPEPGLSGERFAPGKTYFSVRLVELRLATAGRYLTEFLPMCACVLSFQQAGGRRTIPFVAGVDMIRGLVGPDAPPDAAKRIAFSNLAVAENVPTPGHDVTMYLSLCRFNDSSLLRGFLELAVKAATAVGEPVAGAVTKGASDFAGGLMNIFKMDGVETRFGRLDGKAVVSSGYRLLAGSSDAALDPQELVLQDGQLIRRTAGRDATIDDVDYLVVAFEHRSTLVDDTFSLIEAMPFHAHWIDASDKVVRSKGDIEAADAEMIELRAAVLHSIQLTETDRLPLLQLYDVKLEQLALQFKPKKRAGSLGLADALERYSNAPLLGAARGVIADALAQDRLDAAEKPGGKEMAATFNALRQGQSEQLAAASWEELANTARAYVAAATQR